MLFMFWNWKKRKALKETEKLEKEEEPIPNLKKDESEFEREESLLKKLLKHKKRLK